MDAVSAIEQAAQYWAKQFGIDPNALTQLSIATAKQESGLDPTQVGDNGTSFGLFQLHQGGELTDAGLTPQQAFDPLTNAMVAVKQIADAMKNNPNADPGTIAAMAQRPADPSAYAAKVDAILKSSGGNMTNSGPFTGWGNPSQNPINGIIAKITGYDPAAAAKNAIYDPKRLAPLAVGIIVVLIGIALVIADHSDVIQGVK